MLLRRHHLFSTVEVAVTPLAMNSAEGVEAIFVVNTPASLIGSPQLNDATVENKADFIFGNEYFVDYPANITEYYNYAAEQLAAGFYGGVPVVYVTPTRENALNGTVFGCEFGGQELTDQFEKEQRRWRDMTKE